MLFSTYFPTTVCPRALVVWRVAGSFTVGCYFFIVFRGYQCLVRGGCSFPSFLLEVSADATTVEAGPIVVYYRLTIDPVGKEPIFEERVAGAPGDIPIVLPAPPIVSAPPVVTPPVTSDSGPTPLPN